MKKEFAFVLIIGLLGFFLGVSVMFLSSTYTKLTELAKSQSLLSQTTSYRRLAEVTSVNLETSSITARAIDRGFGIDTFVFYVDDRTVISSQNPIIQDGIVVGFEPLQSLSIEDMRPGSQILIRLIVDGEKDNALYAQNITVGAPFVRP